MKKLKEVAFAVMALLVANFISFGQSNVLADEYFQKANDAKNNMQPDSAVMYYQKAAIQYKEQKNFEKFIDSYNQIGIILTRQDKYEEARAYLDDALSTSLNSIGRDHLSVATTYISLGVIENAEGNFSQSLINHNKALAIRTTLLGEMHADVATSYGNLGNVYRNQGDLDRSIEAHEHARKIREHIFGLTSPEIIESYVGLGKAYKEKNEYDRSFKYFELALKNKILQRGEGHQDLVKFYTYLSEISYLMGNKSKGDEYTSKSKTIEKR